MDRFSLAVLASIAAGPLSGAEGGPPAPSGAPAVPMPPDTISLARTPFVFGAGGVGNAMDAMAFFHDGTWHLFHMQTLPRGIAHRASRDLVNWEIRPLAIPGDAATGNVVAHRGKFHLFYTLDQTIHLATSDDLDAWTPSPRNPVAVADGKRYVGPNFRDPYVFYNEEESCWWMLVAAEVPGPVPFRAGCVGAYKSPDLVDWRAAEPLWAPGTGPRHECPQVIRHEGRWYLFGLERQDQYRVAGSLAGPWLRPPSPYLGPHTVLTGTHVTSDGKRWVNFPFLCALRGGEDFGDVVQAEVYAVPRQLDFHPDGGISQRPVVELVEALRRLPPVDPLAAAATLSGRWDLHPEDASARSLGSGGTLLLRAAPADIYLEAEVTLGETNMEASILFRTDPGLTRGYKLTLQPGEGLIALRPFSYWDRDRPLAAQPARLPAGRPIPVRIILTGTVVEAFVDDRHVLSSRVYRHPDGAAAFDAVDGPARFDRILVRPLASDPRPPDAAR